MMKLLPSRNLLSLFHARATKGILGTRSVWGSVIFPLSIGLGNLLCPSTIAAETVTQQKAGLAANHFAVDKTSGALLENYCYDCHDDATQKGNVRLDNLASLDLDTRLTLLNKMQEQVYLKGMPPEKKDQPTSKEREAVFDWLSSELGKHSASTLEEKLQKPHYANYVDHNMLFSGEIKEEAFSPARFWRRNPYHFDITKQTVFDDRRGRGPVDAVKQPFNLSGNEGISDYASEYYADSATFDTMYRNATTIVDQTLLMAFIEMNYKSEGKTMEDWKAEFAIELKRQNEVIEEMKKAGKNPRYVASLHRQVNAKYGIPTPSVYSGIILGDGAPSQSMMEAAIKYHFDRTIQISATQEDLAKYTAYMQDGIKEFGPYFGLRNTLIAVLCSPKFIYRSELGLGKTLPDGRSMLSPVELAYAISYALTDDKPSKELLAAAQNGQLETREDVKREVTKLLEDEKVDKPRILRFFHEFFGYNKAPFVFKDDARFFKLYTFFNAAVMYVQDTDRLVMHILKKDKDVFKELLTTEEYFVNHSGDNKESRAEYEAHQKLYAYFKDKNWKNYNSRSKTKENPTKEDLAYAQSLLPRFKRGNDQLRDGKTIFMVMNYLDGFYKKGIQNPSTYTMRGSNSTFLNSVLAYNLPGKDWDAPVEQPFVVAKGKRAGILSHPSWLIAHSLNTTTDPVRRGKWIREYLLAGTILDVPITVDATVPKDPHKTLRERYSVTEAKSCWKCHEKMNPLGYAFETFDDFGRWRDKETMEDLPKIGKEFETRPINSLGYLDGTGDKNLDGEVNGAYELVNRLAKSRRVQQSFIRHAFRYWMGRNEMLTDSKTLIAAEKAYMDNGGSFNAMLVSLLTSDSFIYRKRID